MKTNAVSYDSTLRCFFYVKSWAETSFIILL